MIYKNVELFNVERIIETEGIPGVVLNRFSEEAVAGIESGPDRRGPVAQAYCNEIEIRFTTEKRSIDIYIGAYENDGWISISNGDYHHCVKYLPKGKITCVTMEKHPRLDMLGDAGKERFSHKVWRISFLKRFTAVFDRIDGKGGYVRPPEKDELPEKTMLAYGSSISFGAGTGPVSDMTCMQILARKLGIQIMNKSMPGSCFCEYSLADYMSGVKADFFYYEMGGNMRLRHSTDEFARRAAYMVEQTRKKNSAIPIILLTVYPLLKELPGEDNTKAAAVIEEYDKTLKKLADNDNNIYLIDSGDILSDHRMLAWDGLHPSGYGNMDMAWKLYEKLKNIVL